MAKGSQLSQLKSALSHAGITGNNNQNGKKRKRSVPQEKDKEKRAAKLDEIQRKLNPFDIKVTKLKHDVGGRKLKGVTGKPAQSKTAGIEQRKKTLLKEFEERHRAGGIIDRRFGENDPSMSLEERMLERFTKERQRASKGVAFNLEDEDELTHYGQSLSKLDDFDDIGLEDDDDDDESGRINEEIVKHMHFGGFDDDENEDNEEPARKKSKAEVMAEVIAKSKGHKIRRQIEKEEGENVRHELDHTFDSLRSLLYAPDPSATGSNSTPLGLSDPSGSSIASTSVVTEATFVGTEKTANYDQAVRELAFDKRAKPKDRTKTEEELAIEEKEALEKAEKRRKKRMLGLENSDSEDEGRSRKRQRGGDDLEDDFDYEETGWNGLGTGLEGDQSREEDSDDDGSDDNIVGQQEEDADESDSEDGDADEGAVSLLQKNNTPQKGKAKELPFTFPCPSTHEEFLEIVETVDNVDLPTVIQRIRALHHTSLASENKFKLQGLTGVLIDHILYVSSPPNPSFSVVSSIFPHIVALTKAYPIQSAEHFNRKLILMHKNLKRGLSEGALQPDAKTWPGPAELTLLRVIGSLWPTSDMNHAVVTPTRILMGSYLGLARVRSLSDVASGLFLCTLFLQYEQLSQRFVPEAVNFIVNSILHLAPSKYQNVSELPGSFPSPDFRSSHCLHLVLDAKSTKGLEVQQPNLSDFHTIQDHDAPSKLNVLALSLDLLSRYANLLKGLEAFIEVFDPISQILHNLKLDKFEADLQVRSTSTKEIIARLLKFSHQSRHPLMLQAHKAIPIPSYVPKFDSTSSSYLRHQDPDRERNEAAKLRNEYKKERKGAIRELRKDARFLAGVEQAKQKEKDRSYNERMKRVFGSLESERAEEKAMEREKIKEKKRAGRK
ncbi:nucleolar protein 14 [Lentinula aciculospora]|uniref:Nucleolar protein 14 n=1 Tax=Lentinula aciculospora TaxID=153920 RepID=A0A9W9A5L6_9AGAR|nr:nucleolar protein 14 [Lentinula aciculospora]